MSEKPSKPEYLKTIAPGMKVVKIGPKGISPEYLEIIETRGGIIKLRTDCGKIMELDQSYFFENYAVADTADLNDENNPVYPVIIYKDKNDGGVDCASITVKSNVGKILFN